ncbi:methyltransferase domain-containing protein [Croceicoccus sp. F390]|uniref:Methyltransferase domain-containing protein n=1 Tax=Croceicoccus esteveae TaxID=3075597 RepID=A0ABU2ZIM3_9SPHN|nr:methyltransferase domain-containing protein [Croceicoccus sp. F390]MDT0576461.1 methyltransferase domain-containing protein [Croceicoccus sp. F390]
MIDALGLSRGDTVVDLCCGSGQNFADLQRKVGSEGRIVGFDISSQMLAIAADHAERHGWRNVELVEADVADVVLPPDMRAAVSTFGLDIVPDVERIVTQIAAQMPTGTRLGLLGSQEPGGWPDWLVRFGIWLNSACDTEREHLSIRPDATAARILDEATRHDFWWGIFYWSVCRKKGDGPAITTKDTGA